MSNRIDLTEFEGYNAWDFHQDRFYAREPNLGIAMLKLIAELKRCYDREDSLLESLNGLLDAVFWDPYEDEDTTLEIDREVAEQIRDSVNEASE